jgi:hypothetical protein
MLHVLLTHGRDYLTDAEFQSRLEQHLVDYYRLLSKSLLVRHDRKFWQYHKRQLDARLHFSCGRLAQAMFAHVCRAALNPRDTIEKLLALGDRRRTERERPAPTESARLDANGRMVIRTAPDR